MANVDYSNSVYDYDLQTWLYLDTDSNTYVSVRDL